MMPALSMRMSRREEAERMVLAARLTESEEVRSSSRILIGASGTCALMSSAAAFALSRLRDASQIW